MGQKLQEQENQGDAAPELNKVLKTLEDFDAHLRSLNNALGKVANSTDLLFQKYSAEQIKKDFPDKTRQILNKLDSTRRSLIGLNDNYTSIMWGKKEIRRLNGFIKMLKHYATEWFL